MYLDDGEEFILPVSQATFEDIASRMEASGMDGVVIMMLDDGRFTPGIQIGNVTMFPAGGPDMQINSGEWSDYETGLGEEAFRAGYEAGAAGEQTACHAWGLYVPSDDIMGLRP